jgi:hypothetical protein
VVQFTYLAARPFSRCSSLRPAAPKIWSCFRDWPILSHQGTGLWVCRINVAETFTEIRRLLEHGEFEYEQKNLAGALCLNLPESDSTSFLRSALRPSAMTEERGVKATVSQARSHFTPRRRLRLADADYASIFEL